MLNRFPGYKGHALGMVITDLSEQKRKQAAEIKQAEVTRRLLLEHMRDRLLPPAPPATC
jgi:hypothetical protein